MCWWSLKLRVVEAYEANIGMSSWRGLSTTPEGSIGGFAFDGELIPDHIIRSNWRVNNAELVIPVTPILHACCY